MTSSEIVGKFSEPDDLKYLEWKIPDFSYWSRYPYPQKYIISPTFIFENISWHISICPFDALSIFLINETQLSHNVNYSFSIMDCEGKLIITNSNNATIKNKSGFTYFFDSEDLISDKETWLPSDSLTIVCIIKPGENVEEVLNCTTPKADIVASSKIVGELNELNNVRQFEWKIPNFYYWSHYPYPKEFLISPTFIFENTSWHIKLEPYGNLSVSLVNETRRPCRVNYSFSIKNCKGTLIATNHNDDIIEDECGFNYFFEAVFLEDDLGRMPPDLTVVCILKPRENEIEISNYTSPKAENDNLQSEIESLKLMKITETDVQPKNLKDLFTNKKCDTILLVSDRLFYTHKSILVAQSSVFAAMFQHDTSEKQTGFVKIPDCDWFTFSAFLDFLYGRLESISIGSAFELYRTSDKYNVQELKVICIKCMMQNLMVQNICDVVIFADKYNEAMLYSAAQEFFIGNFKEISKTSEWESLLKTNCRLANKLLIAMAESK